MAKETKTVDLTRLREFEAIIDVRSPGEYGDDHIPAAANFPVLDDTQRAQVGTHYAQDSFEAKRMGASLIARNIATHLEQSFAAYPRSWRPLVYCWRGGQRSRAMAHILIEVGWEVFQLTGGYKAYRHQVIADLQNLPGRLRFIVVCGATGSGKSRLLQALAARGAQVLDLEALAAHRGSLLGSLPGQPQPAQRYFESLVWQTLQAFDPEQPVFVEAESRKIGALQVPDALIRRMWVSECVFVDVPAGERTRFLLDEYAHFLTDPLALCAKLEHLRALHGAQVIERWHAAAHSGAWRELVRELLLQHYDPAYRRSTLTNFINAPRARRFASEDLSARGIAALAAEVSRHADATISSATADIGAREPLSATPA